MLHHTSCHSLYHISTIWYHNINHIIKSYIISNAVFASISSIHMLLTTIHHYQSNLIIISFDWETINDQIFAFICWDDESIFIASIVCSCITFYLYQIHQSRYNQFLSSFFRFFCNVRTVILPRTNVRKKQLYFVSGFNYNFRFFWFNSPEWFAGGKSYVSLHAINLELMKIIQAINSEFIACMIKFIACMI